MSSQLDNTVPTVAKPEYDVVFLRGLALTAVIGLDTWHRPNKPQPAILDVRMRTNIALAAEGDDVLKTIHYGNLCKAITEAASSRTFPDLHGFALAICQTALGSGRGDDTVELIVVLPKALLLADGLGLSTLMARKTSTKAPGTELKTIESHAFVRDMRASCIIGVNPHERLEKQQVVINLKFEIFNNKLWTDYAKIVKAVADGVEQSSYETLEAMATFIGRIVHTSSNSVSRVMVSVQKPSALMFVGGSGVEITRDCFDGAVLLPKVD